MECRVQKVGSIEKLVHNVTVSAECQRDPIGGVHIERSRNAQERLLGVTDLIFNFGSR